MFVAAGAPVLLLFDEVLNFVNRHRDMAESFHAFLQNLTVAVTGTSGAAAVISLPRSQVEMTDWDQQWQERITKVVRRVARDLIANDESEISEIGEARLDVAIDADLAGETAHARALDADATGALRDIHRRVGATILFESFGGQVDKVAHLPELRFALGEPEVDTTTIDNAATALEASGFFIRKVGTDGYRIRKPRLKRSTPSLGASRLRRNRTPGPTRNRSLLRSLSHCPVPGLNQPPAPRPCRARVLARQPSGLPEPCPRRSGTGWEPEYCPSCDPEMISAWVSNFR